MIPKLATNLLHSNVARVVAAVQTHTQTAFRNVLQFQSQAAQAPANASNSTLSSWGAANNAAGSTYGAGSAKYQAGNKFYSGFQVRFVFFFQSFTFEMVVCSSVMSTVLL